MFSICNVDKTAVAIWWVLDFFKCNSFVFGISNFILFLQVKLTIQGEVMAGTILQQSFVVEYIVNHQMCDDCRRVEAKDTWNASVSFTIEYSQCFLRCLTLWNSDHSDLYKIVVKFFKRYLQGPRTQMLNFRRTFFHADPVNSI